MDSTIYSCFISYRHPASAGGREEKVINHVVRALKDHIEMYTHEHGVYFDQDRLKPGYQYDERLARAICHSACMVVVFWPSYLESDYCQKEIHAMLEIEDRRRKVLGAALDGCRLFVPVLLRGKLDHLPEAVRKDCQYLDYSAQALKPNFNIGDDEAMSRQLFGVAEYVHDLCCKLKNVREQVFGGCAQFNFPIVPATPTAAVQPATQPFPGR